MVGGGSEELPLLPVLRELTKPFVTIALCPVFNHCKRREGATIKKIIFGVVCLLCSAVVYGARLIAASILVTSNAVKGGYGTIKNGLDYVGSGSLWIFILLLLVGLLFSGWGLWEKRE